MRKAKLCTALGLLACDACLADREPVVYEGEHFTLEADLETDVEICAGTLTTIDRQITRIDGELGLDSDASNKAQIKIVPSESLHDYCPDWATGCARYDQIYLSTWAYSALAHELAHQRLRRVGGFETKILFREGLPEALSVNNCISTDFERPSLDLLLELETLQDFDEMASLYMAGGELFNWLLATHGPVPVLSFVTEVKMETTPEQVRAVYFDLFGTSLDEDLYGHLRKPADDYSRAQTGCMAPEASEVDGVTRLHARMICSSPAVQNDFEAIEFGRPQMGLVEWIVKVESDESGYFELHGDIPNSEIFAIYPCVCAGAHPTDFRHQDPPPVFSHAFQTQGRRVLLGAGDYRVEWRAPLDEGLEVDLEFAPVCSFEAQDCPAGQQCTIWNSCEAETAVLAGVGEACDQSVEGLLTCEAWSRCVAGVCTATCDADHACPDGLSCGRSRTCGPTCSLEAQDCEAGWSCVPTVSMELDAQGLGHCQPAGSAQVLESCDMLGNSCDVGLSCERVNDIDLLKACGNDQLTGCCVPLCDPAADDPGCPMELPTCLQRFAGSEVGVCV